jgi:hypothetical protein
MEMNMVKIKVMKIVMQPSPIRIMVVKKQRENVEYFSYLGSMITNYARCTCEIKFRIAMAKVAFNKKKSVFTSKLDHSLMKKSVKCYIWCITLYGAEIWCWRKVEKLRWNDSVRNE